MSELKQFSALVADIYDAALDSSMWSSVLQKLCGFVPGACGNIFVQDATNQYANSVFVWGYEPEYFDSYLATYAKINPFFPTIFFQEVGEVFSVLDIMPRGQFERTRMYQEWVRPQGQLDNVGAILEKSATSCAMLALPQHESVGVVPHETRERLQLLVPHVQRAVLIGKAFDLRKAAAEDFASTIDAVAAAIFLIDSRGNIVHANRSGLTLLAADDVVQAANGRLRVMDRAANQTLNDALARLAAGEDLAIGTGAIHLPSRAGANYVGHVLPLTGGERRKTGDAHHAVAAIFIHKATLDLSSPPEVLAKAYGLTPRELGVLLAVVQAGGIAEVAHLLGLSQATVKTHLRQVFAKTRTARQADLVRLVAGFIGPVG